MQKQEKKMQKDLMSITNEMEKMLGKSEWSYLNNNISLLNKSLK